MPVMSRPSNSTLPWSGRRKPDSSPNSVVLPAPLGPTSALMLPAGTARLTSCTAFRPPKLMDSACACSSMSFLQRARAGRLNSRAADWPQPLMPRGAKVTIRISTTP